jgi:hypothetical protein
MKPEKAVQNQDGGRTYADKNPINTGENRKDARRRSVFTNCIRRSVLSKRLADFAVDRSARN